MSKAYSLRQRQLKRGSPTSFGSKSWVKAQNKRRGGEYALHLRQHRRYSAILHSRPQPEPVTTKIQVHGQAGEPLRFATHQQRVYVLNRDAYACRYCGVALTIDDANIDHVQPFKYGGPTTSDNLVACCQECNRLKGNQRWKPPASIPNRKLGRQSR